MIQDILVKSYDTEWHDRQRIVCHLLGKSSGFLSYQTPTNTKVCLNFKEESY